VPAHITGGVLEFTLSTVVDSYYQVFSGSPNLAYDVMEALDGHRFLGLKGNARLDSRTTPASGTLDGSFDVYAGYADYWSSRLDTSCSSTHTVSMTR